MKNICPIHRYKYNGNVCPICAREHKERIESMYADEIAEYTKAKPITDDDIVRLSEKFNVQIGKK
ncbi:MAG: hypothetical protein J6X18_07990 [Bacteroidales bacterium]|nr:hypothetical protein [Bacteroidales bacterium]